MFPYRQHLVLLPLLLAGIAVHVLGLNMQIDEFYSKSFVPNEIFISYQMESTEALNLNLTVMEHFPGKLLMHIFVRKLDDVPGGPNTIEMIKLKNLDFCKTLESLRNMTIDDYQGESLLPSTFLMSCPLMPGFYYVEHAHFDANLLPLRIKDGRYFAQFELMQVYEEVTKLINCKMKVTKKTFESEQQLAKDKLAASKSNEDF